MSVTARVWVICIAIFLLILVGVPLRRFLMG
jgi:hypothetical protein